MALTCLSGAYLGATTFFKKPQSLLWMTQCLLISFFLSKTITAWGYLTYLSNLTIFNNNNKAMQDQLHYSFFFLSAMLIWSLLWAAPHRSAGMTMVFCMKEGHGFKLQADCQPVFCCLGHAECDLRSYLTWEGQVVKPLALSHSNPPNCLKAVGLSSQGVFREGTFSGVQ